MARLIKWKQAPSPDEHHLQICVVRLLRMAGYIVMDCDVMAGLRFLGNNNQGRILFIQQHKKLGYTKGQPDLLILLPNGRVLFVEMKNGRAGRQSPEQKAFQVMCEKLGHIYRVWRSIDDARNFIRENKDVKSGTEAIWQGFGQASNNSTSNNDE